MEKKKKEPEPLNFVAKGIVHTENIKKEMKYFDKNKMKYFQLNPHNTYVLPEKPNYVNPTRKIKSVMEGTLQGTYTEDPVEEAFSNEKLDKALKVIDLVPKQKYVAPQTGNQEIGWFATTMGKPSVKSHGMKYNEITRWASEYYDMTKINPFKLR